MMVNRLMRQSQQERRIAVQLLQTRQEKEIIKRNRIMREKQHEERRLKEFEDALNREAVSCQTCQDIQSILCGSYSPASLPLACTVHTHYIYVIGKKS